MNSIHKGQCLCGSVRYTVGGPLRDIIACHCRQCRKMSGHYYAATAADAQQWRETDWNWLKWHYDSKNA